MNKNIFNRFYEASCRGWNVTKDLICFHLFIYAFLGFLGVIIFGISYLFGS